MHERSLHVHAEHDAEPDEIDAEPLGRRAEQWDYDEGDLEEIKKKRKEENKDIDEDKKPDHAAGQRDQQLFYPFVTIDPVEGERKHARTDQDEHNEGRQLGGDLQIGRASCRERMKKA